MNNEQMEEIKRHFGVVAEALRSDIRQIAEGHATIRHELQEHREEIRDEFKELRALMSVLLKPMIELSGPQHGFRGAPCQVFSC